MHQIAPQHLPQGPKAGPTRTPGTLSIFGESLGEFEGHPSYRPAKIVQQMLMRNARLLTTVQFSWPPMGNRR